MYWLFSKLSWLCAALPLFDFSLFVLNIILLRSMYRFNWHHTVLTQDCDGYLIESK
jgi:hypothetical protein